MTRFFFHVLSDKVSLDDEGIEFDTALEAHKQAVRTVGEMMQEADSKLCSEVEWSMVVMDEAHNTLSRIKVASERISEASSASCVAPVFADLTFAPLTAAARY